MDTIGKRLKQFRERKGITQGEMAEKANLSQGNITQWEKDRNKPSGDNLLRLLRAFPDLESDWLMSGGSNKNITHEPVSENKRLQKENTELRREISDLKDKLINILLNQKK